MNAPVLALRVEDAARSIGVSTRTLWRLLQAGQIAHVSIGGSTRVLVSDLQTLLDARRSTEPLPPAVRRADR